MSSPVSTSDASSIQELLRKIQALANQIEAFPGIGNSTGTDAAPVHKELKNVRDACQRLVRMIGTGNG